MVFFCLCFLFCFGFPLPWFIYLCDCLGFFFLLCLLSIFTCRLLWASFWFLAMGLLIVAFVFVLAFWGRFVFRISSVWSR